MNVTFSPSYFFKLESVSEDIQIYKPDKVTINEGAFKKLITSLESDLQTKRKYIEVLEKECERKEKELEKLKKSR